MTGTAYAALYASVTAQLRSSVPSDHGRNGKHHSGPCAACGIHVCLTHHNCPRSK